MALHKILLDFCLISNALVRGFQFLENNAEKKIKEPKKLEHLLNIIEIFRGESFIINL